MNAFVALRPLIAGTLAFTALPVLAQTLERAHILVEPLQYSDQGKFRGCGVNLKLLQETDSKTRDYLTVSVNFWLETPSAALIKTALSQVTVGSTPAVKPQAFESSWIRLKGQDPLVPKKSMSGEDSAVLAVVDLSPAIDLVTSILEGTEEIQVGFRQKTLKYERVFYGMPKTEQESRALVRVCFDEFIQRLERAQKK